MIKVVSRDVVLPHLGVKSLLVKRLSFVSGYCWKSTKKDQQDKNSGEPFH
jgi:hypothetical protein